jgi:predicted  nucleic acid-binding Zn-ribbon protein
MNNETIAKVLEIQTALNQLDKLMGNNIDKDYPDIQLNDDIQEIQKHLSDIEDKTIVEIQKSLSDVYSLIDQLNKRDSDRQQNISGLEKQVQKFQTLIKTLSESNSTSETRTEGSNGDNIKLKRMEEEMVNWMDRVQRMDIRLTNLEQRIAEDDGK